jgi:hypothetical protein
MVTCPHCEKKTISAWSKMFTGITRQITCPSCGNVSALSWLALFNLIPYAFTIMYIMEHTRFWSKARWILIALALVSYYFVQMFWVPLVKKSRTLTLPSK